MDLFDQLRDPQRAVRVRQPVQVDSEHRAVQTGDVAAYVEVRISQHPVGRFTSRVL